MTCWFFFFLSMFLNASDFSLFLIILSILLKAYFAYDFSKSAFWN